MVYYQILLPNIRSLLIPELNKTIRIANSHLVSLPFTFSQTVAILGPIIQAQLEFRKKYLESITRTLNSHSVLEQITRQWTQTLISYKADILGLNFDLSYQTKTYTEKRQLVVELDEYQVENGLEVYQTFEKEGKKYKLVAVLESNFEKFSQSTTTLGYSDNERTSSITTILPSKPKKQVNLKFKYNPKEFTLSVGNHSHTLSFSKSFAFINHSLITISNDKNQTIWYFLDLLDTFDRVEGDKFQTLKSCKNAFDYFKKSLVSEIRDLFVVGNKYIKINVKYR